MSQISKCHSEALARANDRAADAEAGAQQARNEAGLLLSDRDHWKAKADEYGAKLEDAQATIAGLRGMLSAWQQWASNRPGRFLIPAGFDGVLDPD